MKYRIEVREIFSPIQIEVLENIGVIIEKSAGTDGKQYQSARNIFAEEIAKFQERWNTVMDEKN